MKAQLVNKGRVESAQRSNQRCLDTIQLQVNSQQPLTMKQKTFDTGLQAQLYSNVSTKQIMYGTDHVWNHIENARQKQLTNQFPPQVIKGEEFSYDLIKKKKQAQENEQLKLQFEKNQKRKQTQEGFLQKQKSNNEIYSRLGLKKTSQYPVTTPTDDPLFVRLARPKELYIPESTYDLPDYRGFILKNLNQIDKAKNPQLIHHFSHTKLLPRSVNRSATQRQFKPIPQEKEQDNDTIRMDVMKLEDQYYNEATDEIDRFEQMLQRQPRLDNMYSQVKHRENEMLKSVEGFKELRNIQKQSNYRHIIGKQISKQILDI